MNIYVDLEFTGLKKDTSIISIGMVDEEGRSLYVEYTDYNKEDVNDWIQENVIDKCEFINNYRKELKPFSITNGNSTIGMGTSEYNRKTILDWLSIYDDIQFVSDVCHYDFILIIDALYDNALSMPTNISPVCYDINNDIAKYHDISIKAAFHISRESIVREEMDKIVTFRKHNSIFDAVVIKLIYEKLNK